MANQTEGWRRLAHAAGYAWQGLVAAWQHEAAFRQEAIITFIALVIVVFLPVSLLAKLMMIGVVMLVLVVELINSAIEAVVDRFGGEHHALSGRAKDMGAAAVMVAVVFAVIVWTTILLTL